MESLMQILKTDTFLVVLFILNIFLIIVFIINCIRFSKLNKKYKNFMIKLGNGKNIEEDLENYMYRVKKIEDNNAEIANEVNGIKNDLTKCIKKVGIIRYSAFQDTGSNLSFALALLDEDDSGVVLNGIYSREMSNIYAKPIKNGKSEYTLIEEEKEAIEKAISSRKDIL